MLTQTKQPTADHIKNETLKCYENPVYFVNNYCHIYHTQKDTDGTVGEWIPFRLWPRQEQVLFTVQTNQLTIILKARQLGLTWLCLGYTLWQMLFRLEATALLFSRRDTEAIHLLDERLKGMYDRLPAWMKCRNVLTDNDHEWELSNGSVARAFPTSAGDSYTATLAVIDEADLVPDLGRIMGAVQPTIDAGGQMVLLSRADKSRPESLFKKIYRAAKADKNMWQPVFLPWHVRPSRDEAWYKEKERDTLANTGALDDLHEHYPATDAEALAPRTLDKRIPAPWLQDCYEEMDPIIDENSPAIPNLLIYRSPDRDRRYVIGVDSAEGNPTSDASALTVLDLGDGEQVATLSGKFQPSVMAGYADRLGQWYNDAPVMVERNNHGHAVIQWLDEHSLLWLLKGHDGKAGWLSSTLGKTLLYNETADQVRDRSVMIHEFETYNQLASIDGSTLRAPDGQHDDRADALALSVVGRIAALQDEMTESELAALFGWRS